MECSGELLRSGGRFSGGTLFRINPAGGGIETLLDFDPATGGHPTNGLINTGTGDLLGIMSSRPGHCVFAVSATDGSLKHLTKLKWPRADGQTTGLYPWTELTVDSAGFLWGTTSQGGEYDAKLGTIFKMEAETGRIVKEISFTGVSGPVKGEHPDAPLVSDGRGYLWSTAPLTYWHGNVAGVLYKVNERTAEVTTVMTFTEQTGLTPIRGLALDGAGWLWGVAGSAGLAGSGVLYKVNPETHEFLVVHSFSNIPGQGDPEMPSRLLLRGNLKSDGAGSIWATAHEIDDNAGNAIDVICRFDWTTGVFTRELEVTRNIQLQMGNELHPDIVRDADGKWWGTTREGGSGGGGGTLFMFDPATGEVITKAPFTAGPAGMISDAGAALIYDRRKVRAVSAKSRSNGAGAIVSYDTESGESRTIREFSGWSNDRWPNDLFNSSPLVRHPDGHLYGTVRGGGSGGNGFVYRLRFRAGVETLPVVDLTGSQVTLSGRVSPEDMGDLQVKLEYSLSPAMTHPVTSGVFDLADGLDATGIAITAGGLVPGMTYYCRAISMTEQSGKFPSGEILPFTTPGELTYSNWKRAFLGNAEAPDDSDSDGDGYSALLEYGLAMSPLDAAADPAAPQFSAVQDPGGPLLSVKLQRDPSHRDVTISVESAADPAGPWREIARSAGGESFTGSGTISGESPGPGTKSVQVMDIAGGNTAPRRFVRVKVQKD